MRIVHILSEPATGDRLAEKLVLPPETVRAHLEPLVRADVLRRDAEGRYAVDPALRDRLGAIRRTIASRRG